MATHLENAIDRHDRQLTEFARLNAARAQELGLATESRIWANGVEMVHFGSNSYCAIPLSEWIAIRDHREARMTLRGDIG